MSKWPWILGGLGVVGAGAVVGTILIRRKDLAEDEVDVAAAEAAGETDESLADMLVFAAQPPETEGSVILTGHKITPSLVYAPSVATPAFTVGSAKLTIDWGQGFEDQRRYVGSLSSGINWIRMMAGRYLLNAPGVQGMMGNIIDDWLDTMKVWVRAPSGLVHVGTGAEIPMFAEGMPPPRFNFTHVDVDSGQMLSEILDENPWGYFISNNKLRKFWFRSWVQWVHADGSPVYMVLSGETIHPALCFFVRTPKTDEVANAFATIGQALASIFGGESAVNVSAWMTGAISIGDQVHRSSRADIQQRSRSKLGFPAP